MSDTVVTVIGVNDLVDSLQDVVKKYPGSAEICLREEARKTRKEIVKNAKDMTNTKSKSKMSLGRIGSYQISDVQGKESDMRIEISARSPHFHLVERGHNIVAQNHFTIKNKKTGKTLKIRNKEAGQIKGKVVGKFYLKKAKEEEFEHFQGFVEDMVDKLLREGSLL